MGGTAARPCKQSRLRRAAAAIAAAAALSLAAATAIPAAAAPDNPSDDAIEQAYEDQANTSASIADLEVQLANLTAQSIARQQEAQAAQAKAQEAGEQAEQAAQEAEVAQEHARQAQEQLDAARQELASIAQAMYRDSAAQLGNAYLYFDARTLSDAQSQSRAFETLAANSDQQVRRFDAMKQVAAYLQSEADKKSQAKEEAARLADQLSETANQALAVAQAEVAQADAQKAKLAELLALQKGTTSQLEADRLANLAANQEQLANAAAGAVMGAGAVSNDDLEAATQQAEASDAAASAAEQEADRLEKVAAESSQALKSVNTKAAAKARTYAEQLREKATADAQSRDAIKKAREWAAKLAAQQAAAEAARQSGAAPALASLGNKPIVDLSSWQVPAAIDYDTFAANISGAVLRIGYTGTYSGDQYYKDPAFETHYAELTKRGIPVGVYWYSAANGGNEGAAEAAAALQYLGGRHLDLPIYIDVEDPTHQSWVGVAALTDQVARFANTVSASGYGVGIYSSSSWYWSKLDRSVMNSLGLSYWVAEWGTSAPSFSGRYDLWQYTSSGHVPGYAGSLDLNARG